MDVLDSFHPAVASWFRRTYAAPTEAQIQAWPAISSGNNALIAAPTGSGKTLAAFLAAIDALIRLGVRGDLRDEIHVVYVSPLKALSNDIQKNLDEPLAGIRKELFESGLPDVDIRTVVRTGDTPQADRSRMRRKPPHILVTTPESLYILLTSASGRKMLSSTRSVIVDEIHALAPNKRGVHLSLSLERLQHLTGRPLTRVGLSATQKPIEEVARFLVGGGRSGGLLDSNACTIVDTGHVRKRDLALEVPDSPLEAVMSTEVWTQVYDRLAELIREHRSTLVFVNTRRLAERAARALSERLGDDQVTSHHGSMAREQRLDAEQKLKRGELKTLVATASPSFPLDLYDKVRTARDISGSRYIEVHAACPPGWGFPNKDLVKIGKLAVDCGIHVLFQIRDGKFSLTSRSLALTKKGRKKSVTDYVKVQSRFRKISPEQIEELQEFTNARWEEFLERHEKGA